jgi:hypothetical protein
MADRELIAATLAAGILSGKGISSDADGAKVAVQFYREVLDALKAPTDPSKPKISRAAVERSRIPGRRRAGPT